VPTQFYLDAQGEGASLCDVCITVLRVVAPAKEQT
jgi:hypothetical protein